MERPLAFHAVSESPTWRAPAQPPPLSLYVHFPWCERKCPYCDFNSHARPARDSQAAELRTRYLGALREDLEAALPIVWGRPVCSVFFGGGTPSLMTGEEVEGLLAAVRALMPLTADCEITLEANPGTMEAQRFRDFRQAGVNRLSLGIQSFNDDHLKRLGRIHDAHQAQRAAEQAGREFERFNLDLMWALPGQTLAQAEQDLRRALDIAPSHLSLYQLTIEANTVFAKFPPELPDEDLAFEMQQRLEQLTGEAGYQHYEVSAYAQPGRTCVHNLNYWTFGDYLGIGAGAHSKLTLRDGIVRQERFSRPESYLDPEGERRFVSREHTVPVAELPFEFMLNALRLTEGIPAALFAQRTGLPLSAISRRLGQAEARGLVEPDPTRIRATSLGLRFLNDLQSLFLAEPRSP
ncbi:MAG TPA: radical SAM family heme chaperone HemW [Burkholderiaceae bacterium]|jgi:oxygen-independent coproporphyrinogen-3 oxidase|nr:radical SAM family heme chaperone HemW [Burkholderiaceae bacterium]